MDEIETLLQGGLGAVVGPDARLVAAHPRAGGAQGYSGATLRYYDVDYRRTDGSGTVTLVTKEAGLIERRTHAWLAARRLPVPPCHAPDLATDAPAPLAMAHVGEPFPRGERARPAARALAAIHHATLGRGTDLPWLPRADPAFIAAWLIDACWRRGWQSVLAGEGHVDAYGHAFGPPKPSGDFAATFAADTPALEAAADRFGRAMAALWAAGDTLTLLNADLHGEHVRSADGQVAVLDWGQAGYGPLYLDLPNLFSREEALHYRAALADLGHDIPAATFLAGYDAARPYVGFKYFGIGLWNWCYGTPPHRPESVQYWIDLIVQGRR